MFQEAEIPCQSAHKSGNVNPSHRPPLPPGIIPGTLFCKRLSRPQGHSAAGRIKSIKNCSDTIGNRTRNLPASTNCANACPNKNENHEYFLEGKGGQCVGLTIFMCRLSTNLGASTSWNPKGLYRSCFTFIQVKGPSPGFEQTFS